MKKFFLNILCFLTIIFLISCKKKNNDNILKVGTDATYPPMEYYENGKIVGFDVDVINLIASKLNKKTQITDMSFDTIFTGLQKNQVDVVISTVTITEERKQQMNFSDPYYYDKTVLIVRNDYDEIKTLEDLEGKKIGTQLGTTQDSYADNVKNAENFKYREIATAMLNLNAKKIDVVLADRSISSILISSNKNCKIIDNISFLPAAFGIAINKDNKQLLNQVNKVLKEIKSSGELNKIVKKWNM